MIQEIEDIRKVSASRGVELAAGKKKGRKIIEYIGNFVPEELIYAAGAAAYLNCRGGEPEPPDAVLTDMLRFQNPLARSQVGVYKLGLDPVAPIADRIVWSQYETHAARAAEYMELLGLPVHKIGVPDDWKRDFAADYYYDQLVDFRRVLEQITGSAVADEAVFKYIRLYNRMNELLRKISDMRKEDAPPIGGADFIKLNHYSFYAEPEYVVDQLEKICDGLSGSGSSFDRGAPRILMIGHSVAVGDYVVVNKLEELGALIAYESLEEGMRWYQWDAEESGDPIRAIVNQKYVNKIPIDNFEPAWEERIKYFEELIKEYRIDGVVWYQLLYDEIWDLEYSCVAKKLAELEIPCLRVETSYEYTREAMLPLSTRLESFVDLLRARKEY